MTTPTIDVHHLASAGHENFVEWLRESTRWSGRAGEIVEEDGVLLYASGTDFPVAFNGVVRTDRQVPADEVVGRADRWFTARGRGYTVIASDRRGVDDDLQAAADAAGLVLLGEPPEMVLRHDISPPALATDVELTWVADRAGLDDFLAVSAGAYGALGMPSGVVEAAIVDVERFTSPWVRSVVARRAGEPLAAAQLLLSHGLAGIYWVGTVERARGVGLAEAVTRAVTNRAFQLGAAAVTLQASPQGEPIYRRLGYERVYGYHRWVRFLERRT